MKRPTSARASISRRSWLARVGIGGAASVCASAYFWAPSRARARTVGFASAKHLILIRLSGGFRFTAAFNGDVASQYNPFGLASEVAPGTEWGPSALIAETGDWWNEARQELGMRPVNRFTDEIAVVPCVDHEPEAASADGNHQSALHRFCTGYVDGTDGLFTRLNRAF